MSQLINIINYSPNDDEKLNNIKHYLEYYNKACMLIRMSIDYPKEISHKIEACIELNKVVWSVDSTEYLLLDCNPKIPRKIYLECFFNLGTLLKNIVEEKCNEKALLLNKNNSNRTTSNRQLVLTQQEELVFNKALLCFNCMLRVDFENNLAIQQIVSIYTQLTFFAHQDLEKSLGYLNQVLFYAPTLPTAHYNLGFIYQRLNNLEQSLIHYKLSIKLSENNSENEEQVNCNKLIINNYNGIAGIYRSIKQWPESLHYLLKAKKIKFDDPDINNQLGVVYTEMRKTDLAEDCYILAVTHYEKTFISTDSEFLLSEIYLNYGHLHSYNGDNIKSIECYNMSLLKCPKFSMPYQNKIFNLTYIFDQLEDKLYITNQHKMINKLYQPLRNEHPEKYVFTKDLFNQAKINVGIISGDFVDHPVSFFISTYLKNFDNSKFNVTCYSECLIDTNSFNNNLKFTFIKNKSAKQVSDIIYKDQNHILLDLAGHTAFNRLDVFALKPSPIQITYIGYPITTGLNEMDYRITDNICDGDLSISQKFYTEKLLALNNCFLCYDPYVIKRNNPVDFKFNYPKILENPIIKNKFLTIGCFNRLNKITDTVIQQYNNIMTNNKNVRFIFKTKALINSNIQKVFISKFHNSVINRITILPCTLSHEQHLETYNQVDISIDTFPYSGTTTSCESLFMGVPVLSLYDSKYFYHPQNVTCSILKNSNMDEYIFNNELELQDKIKNFVNKPTLFWKNIKENTRKQFLTGKVCDKISYMKNIQDLFTKLVKDKNL
jgi:protein O-GlcNAc transferase